MTTTLELPVIQVSFTVSGLSPTVTSLYGGQQFTITGTGLGVDADALNIKIGDTPCTVEESTESEVICHLGVATKDWVITNNGVDGGKFIQVFGD